MNSVLNRIILLVLICSLGACVMPSQVSPQRARKSVQALMTSSVKLMRIGDKDSLIKARSNLELALELTPQDPKVLDGMGCLEWRYGNNARAERWFKEALFINPHFDQSYVNLAILEEQKGQPQKALALLEKAIQLNPLNHKARNNYASLLFDYAKSSGQERRAYGELLKAINSAPEMDNVLEYNLKKFKSSNSVRRVIATP